MLQDQQIRDVVDAITPAETTWASGCHKALESMGFRIGRTSHPFIFGVRGACFHFLRDHRKEIANADHARTLVLRTPEDIRAELQRWFFMVVAGRVRSDAGRTAVQETDEDVIRTVQREVECVLQGERPEEWVFSDGDPDLLLNQIGQQLVPIQRQRRRPIPQVHKDLGSVAGG